jgi:hypothetical protein
LNPNWIDLMKLSKFSLFSNKYFGLFNDATDRCYSFLCSNFTIKLRLVSSAF